MEHRLRDRPSLPYLDILRCAATYFVILLHCIAPYLTSASLFGSRTWWVCNAANSVVRMGVPLFFMISGCLSLADAGTLHLKAYYIKRFRRVAVPFLCWDVIYFLTNCLISHQSPSLSRFFSELLTTGSQYHLWFVYQILGLYLLAPFLKKIIDHCRPREQVLFLLVVLLQPTLLLFFNTVQPCLRIAPFGALVEGYAGFFLFGYLLGTYPIALRRRVLFYCAGAAGTVINIAGSYVFSSPEAVSLPFNAGYSLTHYLTSGAFFLLVRYRFEAPCATPLRRAICALSRRVAGASYDIYLSHVLVMQVVAWLLARAAPLSPAQSIAVSFLSVSVLCTAAMLPLVRLRSLLRRSRRVSAKTP